MNSIGNINSLNGRGPAYLVLFIVIVGFSTLDYSRLNSSTVGVGIDGYYYALQIDSLFNSGTLHFGTSTPLVLYLLAGLKVIFQDTFTAIKVGAVLLHLLLSLSVFGIVATVTKKYSLALFSVILLSVSSLHLYLIVEYINYLGAVAFITWGFFFLLLARKHDSKLWLLAAVGSFLSATASHKSALPTVLILFVAFSIYLLSDAENFNKKLIAGISVVLLFFTPALLAAQSFFILPFELQKELTLIPSNPITRANYPEVITLLTCLITLIILQFRKKKDACGIARLVLGTLTIWSIIITLNPFIFSEQGFLSVGGRLRILAYIQVAIIIPVVISESKSLPRTVIVPFAFLSSSMMIWSSTVQPLPFGAHPDYLERREALNNGLRSTRLPSKSNSIIIAAHGDQFVVTSITGIKSQQIFPTTKTEKDVYWLLSKIPVQFVNGSQTIITTKSDGIQTILIKDDEVFNDKIQNRTTQLQYMRHNSHLQKHLLTKLLLDKQKTNKANAF